MTEQWYLDLDGVRSGPYQTPEVMSLIAEGEVLPHHRIATSLRDMHWITVLDWRLDHAKSPLKTRTQASVIPQAKPPHDEVNDHPEPTGPIEIPMRALEFENQNTQKIFPRSNATLENPESGMKGDESFPPDPIAPSELKLELKTQGPQKLDVPADEAAPAASHPPPKRDPMAEMFDLLQNTKQKRQAKQNQDASAGISIEQDLGETIKKNGLGLGKVLAIGGGIALVGFALGQLFQQTEPNPKDATSTASGKASPAQSSATNSSPPPDSATQVIDRSNDKMTIRAVVKKDDAQALKNAHAGNAANVPPSQTDKELEELRNLKKELQELKALKNNAVDEAPDTSDVEVEPNSNLDPNRLEPTAPLPNNGNSNDPNAPGITTPSESVPGQVANPGPNR